MATDFETNVKALNDKSRKLKTGWFKCIKENLKDQYKLYCESLSYRNVRPVEEGSDLFNVRVACKWPDCTAKLR